MRYQGPFLVERDIKVLRALAAAGALGAQHLHALCGGQGQSQHFSRRLRQLSGGAKWKPYIQCFLPPSQEVGAIYMLTAEGADVIDFRDVLSLPVKMSWSEWRHLHMAGDVFVGLMKRLEGTDPLPFKWRADRGEMWEFKATLPARDSGAEREEATSVRPDAIVDSTTHTMRVFLEFETGTHSIQGASTGAVLQKVRRYAAFATTFVPGVQPPVTWYQAAFPDGRVPMVMVVAHSSARREKVAKALAGDDFLERRLQEKSWGWLVVTPEDAPFQLQRLMSGMDPVPHESALKELGLRAAGTLAPATAPRPEGDTWVRMEAAGAKQLSDDVRALLDQVNSYRKAMGDAAKVAPKPVAVMLRDALAAPGSKGLPEVATRILDAIKGLRAERCPPPASALPSDETAAA